MVHCYSSVPLLLPLKIFILIYSSLCVSSSTRWLGISLTADCPFFFTSPHPEPLSRRWHHPGFVSPSFSTLAEEAFWALCFSIFTPSHFHSAHLHFLLWRNYIYFKQKCPPILFPLYKLATVGLTCAEVRLALNQISMSNDDSGSEDDGFICLFFIWSQHSAETDFPH